MKVIQTVNIYFIILKPSVYKDAENLMVFIQRADNV